ncbi:helix-turn-helix domain-containing protein [Nocardioides terrisoli]|uniref:helix-turn-helix domain-containing protein n=1 Tax=Nocardioides terrisoli TaxID=3388267 RepID=UPI00287B7123|nr:helix-turn-helix domain-containing protein [Nocardioides marmorisolisilvae]
MATNSADTEAPVFTADLAGYRLLTSNEAAAILGVPVATLRTWRSRRRGYGPPAVHLGGNIRYRPQDLLGWIDAHTETANGDPPDGIAAPGSGVNPPPARPLTRQRRPRPASLPFDNNRIRT